MAEMQARLLNYAAEAVAAAQRAGATSADALAIASVDMNAGMRLGQPETIERAESHGIGLRVFVGQSSATLSTSDLSDDAMRKLADTAIAVARAAPADPFAGLAEEALLARSLPTLALMDADEPTMEQLQERARRCEEAGRAVAGITNSEGADAGYSRSYAALATSHGFAQAYGYTQFALSCSLIAGSGDAMQRDYDYSTTVFGGDLPASETIGHGAAQRTLQRLNPRKLPSQQSAVFFDPRAGKQLLGALAGAISGSAITRGTSFLKDSLGKAVFAPGITIIDDALLPRGLGSHPFDAEGIAASKRTMVEDGVLQSWLLDCRSARQLGMQTTGHAIRGLSGAPSPSATNLYIAPGEEAPQALFASMKNGLLVTETIGHGTNLITGDYSVGASGFWIEDGQIAYPVSEVTIAGNLKEIYANLVAANDLQFTYRTNVPTLMVPRMTIAGN